MKRESLLRSEDIHTVTHSLTETCMHIALRIYMLFYGDNLVLSFLFIKLMQQPLYVRHDSTSLVYKILQNLSLKYTLLRWSFIQLILGLG